MQRLRPQARAYLVWDTVQRGLALRVEPAGYMAYEVVYRHHKKQLRSARNWASGTDEQRKPR